MSYLFVNNQEIKNDSGNPIPSEIIHNGSSVSSSNPLPVEFSNASINIGAEVEISNDSGNPVPISGTVSVDNFPAFPTVQTVDGTVTVGSYTGSNLPIQGTVSVDNFPAFPTVQTVRGIVELDSTSLISLENINADVTGTVSVDNFPAFPTVQTVSLDSSSREALENITAVVSFPAVQTITGTVSLDSGSLISLENVTVNVESSVEVSNFPAVQTVSLDSSSRDALENITAVVTFPAVQTVSGTVLLDSTSLSALENITVTGTVDVGNTVSISGSVTATVDNFPTVQTVSLDSSSRDALENITAVVTFPDVQNISGTVLLDSTSLSALENINATVSGTVSVDNFPAFPDVQNISGTVLLDSTSLSALENINATVSGTVSVDNFPAFPAIQQVSGTVLLDSTSLSALENITVNGTVDIGNTVTVSGSVTSTIDNFPSVQTVTLDSSSRDALENINAVVTFPDVQTVTGTVLLDSTSLSALENINATVNGTISVNNFPTFPSIQEISGTVLLDSTSLSALENITVTGSVTATVDNFPSVQIVSLDSSSRDALENITAVVTFPDVQEVSGTVLLDSTSLSALENITATVSGTVSIDNFPANQTVTISELPEVEIKNDSNNPISISRNTTQNSESNPIFVKGTSDTTFFNPTQIDAFGRLRVSNPVTLFDAQNRYIDGELFSSDNSGSGSVVYNLNSSNFTLSVSGNGDEVIRQAKRVTLYQPGKSLLIMNTFAFNTPTANLRQRVGYFTTQNGIFLEADGTDVYIVKRSYTSGSAVDTRVAQADWNNDTFDGNGSSGITLDVSKTQILWTDIEWLGVGSVRVGFVINGQYVLAHTFHHANSLTDVYMTTASLNCRYEITSTGAAGSMRQICSTVISEGGYAPTPPIYYIGNGTIENRLVNADTLYPLASIRLDPNTPDAVVVPSQIDFLSVDVRYGEVRLVEGATLTGASFNNSVSSVVETDTSATAMSGGTTVYSTLWASRSELEFTGTIKRRLQLAREADGTPIVLTFAAASNSSNTDILYKFGWEEWSN